MILGVYGYSKSGKTQLVERLLRDMTSDGYKVASIKHISKKRFTVDSKGTDTWRHARSGADLVVASSSDETAFIGKKGMKLKEIIEQVRGLCNPDAIILEGFKKANIPKVAVGKISKTKGTVLTFDGNYKEILGYVKDGVEIDRIYRKLPHLDCGECGYDCQGLAKMIFKRKSKFNDCPYFFERRVEVSVDGRMIPVGKFANIVIANTVKGLISSLKGTDEARFKTIRLEIG